MQWMTVTSLVPCHALHAPQHVAVSLSEPLNHVISSAPSTETVFAYPSQVSLTATVTCNQYYLLSCGADGAR